MKKLNEMVAVKRFKVKKLLNYLYFRKNAPDDQGFEGIQGL